MNDNLQLRATLLDNWLSDKPLVAIDTTQLTVNAGSSYYAPPLVTEFSINPLINNAEAIFSLINQLRYLDYYRELPSLQQQLVYEIKTFERRAQSNHYRPEYIHIARYLLCAFCDEIISQTSWGNQWAPYHLLWFFHQEHNANERFYTILQRLQLEPQVYVELLELIYLCLSLGYLGQYRYLEHSMQQHLTLMDSLYQTIRSSRGDTSNQLANELPSLHLTTMDKNDTRFTPKQLLLITGVVLILIYGVFSALVNVATNPLVQDLKQLEQPLLKKGETNK